MYPIVTAAEMRALEVAAEAAGWSSPVLMERAGLAIAEAIRTAGGTLAGRTVLVLAGPGNNGGDALVVGRHLARWGARVLVYAWRRSPDAHLRAAEEYAARVVLDTADPALDQLGLALAVCDVVVDGLLGAGASRPIEGRLAEIVRAVSARRARPAPPWTVAVDLPTGLATDTGALLGPVIAADLTVTLGAPKRGLFEPPGRDYCGQLCVVDIGLVLPKPAEGGCWLLDAATAAQWLPVRSPTANKGTFGRVLVIGGSIAYLGAPALAAAAALRAGAGLVTLAVPASIKPVLAARMAEPTFLPLPETSDGALGPAALAPLLDQIATYEALVIGPGLGRQAPTGAFIAQLLQQLASQGTCQVVLDADALNLLAEWPDWWQQAPAGMILTPHPGEMGRLTGRPAREVVQDRYTLARAYADQTRQILVLKGAHTLIAVPAGPLYLSPIAHPALATAGTGDVLAGTIGALLAQGVAPPAAAALGVYLHGRAGELAAPGASGLLAGDLLPALPRAFAALRSMTAPHFPTPP